MWRSYISHIDPPALTARHVNLVNQLGTPQLMFVVLWSCSTTPGLFLALGMFVSEDRCGLSFVVFF